MSGVVHETTTEYERTTIPQLNSGDVLDRDEYLRRYEAAHEKLKAERINGRVYLMNALRARQHGNPHLLLGGWLFTYAMSNPDLNLSDNATLHLDTSNDPQPDLCVYRTGGRATLNDEGYLVGVPEMIVEIAGSSASYDFGEKRDVYEAAGVGEYLVFETIEGRIEWWRHDGSRFIDVPRQAMIYKSATFPGLWLDGEALRSADRFRLIETLRQGMQS